MGSFGTSGSVGGSKNMVYRQRSSKPAAVEDDFLLQVSVPLFVIPAGALFASQLLVAIEDAGITFDDPTHDESGSDDDTDRCFSDSRFYW